MAVFENNMIGRNSYYDALLHQITQTFRLLTSFLPAVG